MQVSETIIILAALVAILIVLVPERTWLGK